MAGYLDWKEGSARKVRHRPLFPTTGTIENLGWISLWCGWQSCELKVFVCFFFRDEPMYLWSPNL